MIRHPIMDRGPGTFFRGRA